MSQAAAPFGSKKPKGARVAVKRRLLPRLVLRWVVVGKSVVGKEGELRVEAARTAEGKVG